MINPHFPTPNEVMRKKGTGVRIKGSRAGFWRKGIYPKEGGKGGGSLKQLLYSELWGPCEDGGGEGVTGVFEGGAGK